jgi:DNA-binding NarL/FixJ family response regulator
MPPMRANGPAPGARAVAVVDLRPDGVVRLGGEQWSATSAGDSIPAGASVEVVERVGLRLTVRALEAASAVVDAPSQPASELGQSSLAPLTAREREVAALIARGMTNRQIADELVVAETTVDRHVSHILGKLEFATRAQVAVWFAQRQPIAAPSTEPR